MLNVVGPEGQQHSRLILELLRRKICEVLKNILYASGQIDIYIFLQKFWKTSLCGCEARHRFATLSVFLFVCLSVCVCLRASLSVRQPHCMPVCLSIRIYAALPTSLFDCVSVCLSACLPERLPASLSVCPSACLPPCLPVCLYFRLPASPNACLPAFLPACLSVCIYVRQPVSLSACLPVCLSFCLPVCPSACLSVILSAVKSVSLPGCLLACLPASLLPVWLSIPACLAGCSRQLVPAWLSTYTRAKTKCTTLIREIDRQTGKMQTDRHVPILENKWTDRQTDWRFDYS